MTTIQWRPEANSLTTPQSYWPRHIPRAVISYDDLAARIAAKNPVYNEGLGKGFMLEMREAIKEELANGNQITLEGLFTCHLTFTARMDSPNDPLPPPEESLQVKLYASKRLIKEVRQAAQTERLPMAEKLPVISSAADMVFELSNVLNPKGLLRLTGTDLLFDRHEEGYGCVLEGTRNGRIAQSRFGTISNSEVIIMPDIPNQPNPWNNEYRVSLSTRYTENGSLRTGTYRRMLRTPLAVELGRGDGILSGGGNTALVTVNGGTLTEDSTQVRIQARLNVQNSELQLNLLDMKEKGNEGDVVTVSDNGTYTLQGFAGSALTELEVTINKYTNLVQLIRTSYTGRLVDILDVSQGS